jgi:hypothetical protein
VSFWPALPRQAVVHKPRSSLDPWRFIVLFAIIVSDIVRWGANMRHIAIGKVPGVGVFGDRLRR